jgi:chaperonin GroES
MFKPLLNRVLIEPESHDTQTTSGIILPENKEKPRIGTVVVGNEDVKAGDRVLFSLFGMDELNLDGKHFVIVSDSAILGIFV